jgi:hypothetical protein
VDPNLAESEPARCDLSVAIWPKEMHVWSVVGSNPNELIFVKTHQGQSVRYKLRPEGKRGGTSSQHAQGHLRSSKTQ